MRILGIDPGRSKTGLALVEQNGSIVKLYIAQTSFMAGELKNFLADEVVKFVVIGDGTNSKVIADVVKNVLPNVAIEFVGEAHSTEEARALYWQENPPTGLRKLIPLGLQVPPIPLDAYAAVVQVRRYLKNDE